MLLLIHEAGAASVGSEQNLSDGLCGSTEIHPSSWFLQKFLQSAGCCSWWSSVFLSAFLWSTNGGEKIWEQKWTFEEQQDGWVPFEGELLQPADRSSSTFCYRLLFPLSLAGLNDVNEPPHSLIPDVICCSESSARTLGSFRGEMSCRSGWNEAEMRRSSCFRLWRLPPGFCNQFIQTS